MLMLITIFEAMEPTNDSAHVLVIIDDAMDQIEALQEEHYIDQNGWDIPLNCFNIQFDHVNFGYDQ